MKLVPTSISILALSVILTTNVHAQTTRATGTGAGGGPSQVTAGNQNQTTDGLNTAAGSSESINREFNEGLVGQSDTTDRFVGQEQSGVQRLNQTRPNFQQRNQGQVQGGESLRTSKVRPVLRIAFDIPEASRLYQTRTIPRNYQLSFRLAQRPEFRNVNIMISPDGTLLLRGNVLTDRDRKLVESFVRLEPGVNDVENQLIVLPAHQPQN